MCVRAFNGGNNTMNKKLIALLAVATMGISVVGATPQTQFTKGETQVDLSATSVETKADVYGKAGIGTKETTTWEAGLGYKATDNHNVSFQGPVVGLSYLLVALKKLNLSL